MTSDQKGRASLLLLRPAQQHVPAPQLRLRHRGQQIRFVRDSCQHGIQQDKRCQLRRVAGQEEQLAKRRARATLPAHSTEDKVAPDQRAHVAGVLPHQLAREPFDHSQTEEGPPVPSVVVIHKISIAILEGLDIWFERTAREAERTQVQV